mgnify:CR=1 FL=1
MASIEAANASDVSRRYLGQLAVGQVEFGHQLALARHEAQARVMRRHARVDGLAADDQPAFMAFLGEPLGEGDAGREMAAGTAAGEQHAAHARASFGSKAGWPEARTQLRISPTISTSSKL